MDYNVFMAGSGLLKLKLTLPEVKREIVRYPARVRAIVNDVDIGEIVVFVPGKEEVNALPYINHWELNDLIIRAGICGKDVRILTGLTGPGPVPRFCSTVPKVESLVETTDEVQNDTEQTEEPNKEITPEPEPEAELA